MKNVRTDKILLLALLFNRFCGSPVTGIGVPTPVCADESRLDTWEFTNDIWHP